LDELDATGQLSPREDRYLTSATRAPKHRVQTRGDLDRHWTQTASDLGFQRGHLERLRQHTEQADGSSRQELLRRLTEFDAAFTDREARAAALEASAGLPIHEALAVLAQLEGSGELLTLTGGGRTTSTHRQLEQQTLAAARRLATERTSPIPDDLVEREVLALEADVHRNGGVLTAEQLAAIQVACSDHRIAMIEGQAGSGKSTVLSAIARAHQAGGQRIIVTSTAALAAQRLASELHGAGVDASSYSTAALSRAIESGSVALSPYVTVIHDEAALASTREQQQLFTAVEAHRARLIEVGDPRQSQAVGAAGLWAHLEEVAHEHDADVHLNTNVRALDPANRRDQQLFRDGQHERALHGYHDRRRLHLHEEQQRAEDAALEAAQADRQAGERTIVIGQTSNEHLDELNARAQAIRAENRELGEHALPLPHRPYQLHANDEIQVPHSIPHRASGHLRNGTIAEVLDVDVARELVTLRLSSGEDVVLDRDQLDRADLRLAYVQHPFPAQGQTTDTAHLIVSEHATQEGTYVALTRARNSTHLYASVEQLELPNDRDPLAAIAEHLGRREPQVPSIDTPLAHESSIEQDLANELVTIECDSEPRPWVATLGREPRSDSPERAAWERATAAVENYRARYNIQPADQALLGPEPPPEALPQRHERRQTAAAVLEALDELEIDRRDRSAIEQRPCVDRVLAIEEREHANSIGWEP
jgi:ABC-type dipeptide/oligopeptide/nickel transport system ATPase component